MSQSTIKQAIENLELKDANVEAKLDPIRAMIVTNLDKQDFRDTIKTLIKATRSFEIQDALDVYLAKFLFNSW